MDKTHDYQRRVNAVINHVAADLTRTYSIDELASVSHFSKFHFHRVFKAISGESVSELVCRLRLEAAAATLIYSPSSSVTTVAMDHGFSSGANFTKAFSKVFGCSPSAYRTSNSRTPENSKIGKAKAGSAWDTLSANSDVGIVDQPQVRLAYLRRHGAYDHEEIERMHMDLREWVDERDCAASDPLSIGITWSDSHIATEERWRYDACLSVRSGTQGRGRVNTQTLPSCRTAQLRVSIAPNESPDLRAYWDWLLGHWLVRSRYELEAAPSYEIYDEADEPDRFNVRLCLPLVTGT